MDTRRRQAFWAKFVRLRRQRRIVAAVNIGLVMMGPILALATYIVLGPMDQGAISPLLRLVLMSDLIYVLLIVALVLQRVLRIVAQRRQKSAGSRLHLRLTGVFTIMALLPTITVAIFAILSVNMGLEAWFSTRVQSVISASLSAAQSYEQEQKSALREDAIDLASRLVRKKIREGSIDPEVLRDELSQGQLAIQRGLREAFIIDETGAILFRGDRSYLFDFEDLTQSDIDASLAEVVLIEDWVNNEMRALVYLDGFSDYYLYVTRDVDGELLSLLDDTQQTALFYQQRESERGRVLFDFGVLYLAFAVLLILASVLLALWFAERLSRPIGRLAGAAQRVGQGELDTQVIEEEGDDEIAQLGVYFNQMTRQLKAQRDTLLESTAQVERRRRMFDSVLTSVTSGVVGLDPAGSIAFVNRSAERLLGWSDTQEAVDMVVAVPEFGPLFDRLKETGADSVQEEIKVIRSGRVENLLVRMSKRHLGDDTLEGYVVAFDDVTDLVSAQRSAAWGDVARRIAHEIKNPLTPIQLSAERIKRKFGPKLAEESQDLEQLTGVIVRQTNDLRRIVDEFSKFARMPEPEKRLEDIVTLVNSAYVLQMAGQPKVDFSKECQIETLQADVDATMISQALMNLLKNAGEAIETRLEKGVFPLLKGRIHVGVTYEDNTVQIRISDNGIGLPQDRSRLFEPYVTTRDKGTGLGLPIVKKIIEEHGGTLRLVDAEPFDMGAHFGACAIVELPVVSVVFEG